MIFYHWKLTTKFLFYFYKSNYCLSFIFEKKTLNRNKYKSWFKVKTSLRNSSTLFTLEVLRQKSRCFAQIWKSRKHPLGFMANYYLPFLCRNLHEIHTSCLGNNVINFYPPKFRFQLIKCHLIFYLFVI